ncbi:MAG TPA: hypothetical protein VMW72_14680 [Sedimentisphaerales bacterium]|nr:hypothetical protein [Sedimentisphaerales bacterium]
MKVKKLLFYLLAAFLGGCIPVMSLHSLYTEENVVFEEKLLGTWVDDPNSPEVIWEFTHIDEPKNAYKLIFSDDKGKGSFVAHLVKLRNRLFLDVYPGELPWEPDDPNKEVKWLYNVFFLVPVHTFIKVDSIEPQLKMRLTNDDKMEELLKEDPNAVKHTSIEDMLILTASTKELQAFVLKYADDNRVFTNEVVLNRRETEKPNTPKAIEP